MGSSKCRSGATLIYPDTMEATPYVHYGGGSNYLGMPNIPQYSSYNQSFQGNSFVYGVEYEQNIKHNSWYQYDVLCAACYVLDKHTSLMYPSKLTCPNGWTIEYKGYVMNEFKYNYRTMFICVDQSMETIPGTLGDNGASPLVHVESSCGRVRTCSPYTPEKELTCVVSSK